MQIRFNKQRAGRIITIFLLAFPHLRPDCVVNMWPALDVLFNAGRILSLLVIIALNLYKRKTIKSIFVVIVIAQLWLTLSTVINGSQNLMGNLVYMGSAIAIPLLINCYADHMDETIDALFMNYEWLIYASLISIMLFYPNGMYIKEGALNRKGYFLGNENQIIFYAVPAITLALLRMKKAKNTIRSFCLIAACVANEVLVWCATGIIGLAVMGVVFFVIGKWRFIQYYTIYFITLIGDLLVTVFRIIDKNGFIAHIITNVLGKTVTLSGRTLIWDEAYPIIGDNLLIGLGRGNHIPASNGALHHCHNQYFELLLEGGVPLLIIFLIMVFIVGYAVSYTKTMTYGKRVMIAALACLFIQFIATQRITAEIFIPFVLAYFCKGIDITIGCRPGKRPALSVDQRQSGEEPA